MRTGCCGQHVALDELRRTGRARATEDRIRAITANAVHVIRGKLGRWRRVRKSDGMNPPDLGKLAKLLADVVDIYGVLVDPRTVPASASPAAEELQAAREQAGQNGAWGEDPLRRAYGLATTKYQVALTHAKAMVALMTGEHMAVPVVVLARALVLRHATLGR
jgi:hypothetical protein